MILARFDAEDAFKAFIELMQESKSLERSEEAMVRRKKLILNVL